VFANFITDADLIIFPVFPYIFQFAIKNILLFVIKNNLIYRFVFYRSINKEFKEYVK